MENRKVHRQYLRICVEGITINTRIIQPAVMSLLKQGFQKPNSNICSLKKFSAKKLKDKDRLISAPGLKAMIEEDCVIGEFFFFALILLPEFISVW